MNDIITMENSAEYYHISCAEACQKIYESDHVENFCHGGKVLSEKEKYRRHRKANRKEVEKKALRKARAFKDGTTAQRAVEKKAEIRRRRYAA
ncbi:MAG: hypothetical protein MJZ20_12310 [Bacteroidaceae bacterium]|nr:hypothetical protein [Bacteroidaceae bacterium]